MFAESKPGQMENNVRCMGNYLNYTQVLCSNVNYIIFISIHSLIHSLCLLFTGQGEKKSNCILHPRWPSGMKYKLKILVISKGLKKLKFDL